MCEIAVDEDLTTRFRAYIANDDVDDVGRLLMHDHVALGLSDAGAHIDQLCDAPLPTDLLGTWVRDREVVPLEHAVRKLTGEPADMFGFVRARLPARGLRGRRVRVRSGDGRHRSDAARARLPRRRRTPDGRGADRRPARARQRHADPGRRSRSSTRRVCGPARIPRSRELPSAWTSRAGARGEPAQPVLHVAQALLRDRGVRREHREAVARARVHVQLRRARPPGSAAARSRCPRRGSRRPRRPTRTPAAGPTRSVARAGAAVAGTSSRP